MATKVYRIVAPVLWAKVFEQNRDLEGFEGMAREFGGQYTVEVKLTNDQLSALESTGSLLPEYAKETGEDDRPWQVKFKRKHKDRFQNASGAPSVFLVEDKPESDFEEISWAQFNEERRKGTQWNYEEDGPIGNGSICAIYIEVYETKRKRRGKVICGTRLVGVGVLEHVPYKGGEDEEEVPF